MNRIDSSAGLRLRRARGRLLGAVGGALAISLAAGAFAAEEGRRGHQFPLSLAEARDRAEARFQELDADRSGEVSAEELAASRHLRLGHRGFHHGRKGGAESVDADLFGTLDENADGLLSREEFSSDKLRNARRQAMRAQVFANLDEDGSGGLSREELPSPVRWLTAMDADGDGTVTREEARAHHKAMREAGGRQRHDGKG